MSIIRRYFGGRGNQTKWGQTTRQTHENMERGCGQRYEWCAFLNFYAYSSHIGYPYVGASSSNYVALCTQLSPDAVQRIWGASFNQLHSRVPVCDRHLPTSLYRGHGPSSASESSVMPARISGVCGGRGLPPPQTSEHLHCKNVC